MERKNPLSFPNKAVGRIFFVCGSRLTPFAIPLSGTVDEEVHQGEPDVVEHDRSDHFVDAAYRLEDRGHQGPERAAGHCGDNQTGTCRTGGRCR